MKNDELSQETAIHAQLVDFVADVDLGLVDNNQINLGKLVQNEAFTFHSKQFLDFIARICEYSLLRYEMRLNRNRHKKKRIKA